MEVGCGGRVWRAVPLLQELTWPSILSLIPLLLQESQHPRHGPPLSRRRNPVGATGALGGLWQMAGVG